MENLVLFLLIVKVLGMVLRGPKWERKERKVTFTVNCNEKISIKNSKILTVDFSDNLLKGQSHLEIIVIAYNSI